MPGDAVVGAAQQLSYRHKGGLCAHALVHAYREARASAEMIQIIDALQAIVPDISPDDKTEIVALADEESRSPDLHVRIEARQLGRQLK